MAKKFQPTEKQMAKWSALAPAAIPSDEEFKAKWTKQHHGKSTGWGMGKRDWVAAHSDDHLTQTVEYNMGLWQGRIDAMNGEEAYPIKAYDTDPYDYGYYSGYSNFKSFWAGCDAATRENLKSQFGG